MLETDLYTPVKAFFTELGYTVKAEVEGCDLVARRGDELVIVELKKNVSLTLILQGIDRQRMTDSVYLAVQAPKNPIRRPWRETVRLCRLLGLGLLTVTFRKRSASVYIVCDPEEYQPRKSAARRRKLLREFEARSGDYNVGGSNRRPIMTAYREEALRVAHYLKENGPSRLKEIREAVDSRKTNSILQRNVYGWYNRPSRGVYELTPEGEKALQTYADVVAKSEDD